MDVDVNLETLHHRKRRRMLIKTPHCKKVGFLADDEGVEQLMLFRHGSSDMPVAMIEVATLISALNVYLQNQELSED